MLTDQFDFGGIQSVNFCVALKGDARPTYLVPVDGEVRLRLEEMLNHTVRAFNTLEGDWEEYDVSEDYGAPRKIWSQSSDEKMAYIKATFDAQCDEEMTNLDEFVTTLDFYYVEAFDKQGRKIVGFKKATQFKATVGARGKLIRLLDDTLTVVEEAVFRLDNEYDLLCTADKVFILNARNFEYVGDVVNLVAGAATEKVEIIQNTLQFLDLSRIHADIGKHRSYARLAASVAARPDLDRIDRAKLCALASGTGVKLKDVDGKLRPTRDSEYALLQLLDFRRYTVDITDDDPLAFEARARKLVAAS